jgi:hypothetical protein
LKKISNSGSAASASTSARPAVHRHRPPRRAGHGRRDEANKELTELTLAVAAPPVRVLLSTNGFNVAKTMSVIGQWIEKYGREADGSAGG